MNNTIVFRVDASILIGTGHVFRCLTLADGLKEKGSECIFVCREHEGNLIELIEEHGYVVYNLDRLEISENGPQSSDLKKKSVQTNTSESELKHSDWLGTSWVIDAAQTYKAIAGINCVFLVVDHYALGRRWEKVLKDITDNILVIDDLADRSHDCEILLDQNLGRNAEEYGKLVPSHCNLMVGTKFALLRKEFPQLRDYSLKRRLTPRLNNILISMGGIDKGNATGKILKCLSGLNLPNNCQITVVMGLSAPNLVDVQTLAKKLPIETEVVVNINNMAERMMQADLAIGAAGSTSWERCCLGLPTLLVVLADNQKNGANALSQTGAAFLVGTIDDINNNLPTMLNKAVSSDSLKKMSTVASTIVDGYGTSRIISAMEAMI
jgi:UDP-2,4-diacetamido-2,4,6-trideoxy-beta-L-altropyranose hydrolase